MRPAVRDWFHWSRRSELDAGAIVSRRRFVAHRGTQPFDRTRAGLVPTASAELLLMAAQETAAAHARISRRTISTMCQCSVRTEKKLGSRLSIEKNSTTSHRR
jgi:3-oxoacyl-(acyl-carrier-protein) synthase